MHRLIFAAPLLASVYAGQANAPTKSRAEELAHTPPAELARLDAELKNEKHITLQKVLHFYFDEKTMQQDEYSQDVSTVNRMFNDADQDSSGDIDWKEWIVLDETLREFDAGFYARQDKEVAEAEQQQAQQLKDRAAKRERWAQEDLQAAQRPQAAEDPVPELPQEAAPEDPALLAAIEAQQRAAAAGHAMVM